MERGGRPGKRVGLIRQIRQYEDAVEADLQRYYRIDYRDRWRGTLPLRRLLVLVDHLPDESAFKSAREGRLPISVTDSLLMDVWSALTGKKHTRWDALKSAARRAERETVIRRRRAAARAHNQRAIRARQSAN